MRACGITSIFNKVELSILFVKIWSEGGGTEKIFLGRAGCFLERSVLWFFLNCKSENREQRLELGLDFDCHSRLNWILVLDQQQYDRPWPRRNSVLPPRSWLSIIVRAANIFTALSKYFPRESFNCEPPRQFVSPANNFSIRCNFSAGLFRILPHNPLIRNCSAAADCATRHQRRHCLQGCGGECLVTADLCSQCPQVSRCHSSLWRRGWRHLSPDTRLLARS